MSATPLPPGSTRPWYACSGSPCTCPKPASAKPRDAEAILEEISDLLSLAERARPAFRYVAADRVRALITDWAES